MAKLLILLIAASRVKGRRRCSIHCMMVVELCHLLCIAVEHPMDRSL